MCICIYIYIYTYYTSVSVSIGRRARTRLPGEGEELRVAADARGLRRLAGEAQVLGAGGRGFRVWGFRVQGFRVLGFRVSLAEILLPRVARQGTVCLVSIRG